MTYLFKSFEVEGAIFIDVFGLIAEDLAGEVVQQIGESSRDGELLQILACHLVN